MEINAWLQVSINVILLLIFLQQKMLQNRKCYVYIFVDTVNGYYSPLAIGNYTSERKS